LLKLKIYDETGAIIYDDKAEHLSSLISANVGYDEVNKTWIPVGITDKGFTKGANYVWNPDTLAWETATGGATPGTNVSVTNFPATLATTTKQDDIILELQKINSLVPAVYDYISLGYTGDDLTSVVFKTGGAGGSTVSTLTLAYIGGILQSVTKT